MNGGAPAGVVLCVHGLWMNGLATTFWRNRLRAAGLATESFSYASVRAPRAASAARLAERVAGLPHAQVHFAGHSFGGLLICAMLAERGWRLPGKTLGRVVLVGSPWGGSHVATQMAARRGNVGRWMLGAALPEWLTKPRPALPPGLALASIAGTLPLGAGRLLGPGLPEPHDGTVSVSETRVPGAVAHLTLPVSHTGMLLSARVVERIAEFVREGRFA
jgi:pimeloyl-ACP methyl ester carboxylesterase